MFILGMDVMPMRRLFECVELLVCLLMAVLGNGIR